MVILLFRNLSLAAERSFSWGTSFSGIGNKICNSVSCEFDITSLPGGSHYTGTFDLVGYAYDKNVYYNDVNINVIDSNGNRVPGAESTCLGSSSQQLGVFSCRYAANGLTAGQSYSITATATNPNRWQVGFVELERGIFNQGSSTIMYKPCNIQSCTLSTGSLPALSQGETYIIYTSSYFI